MNTSVYALFGLDSKSSPHDILKQCRDKCDQWTLETVTHRLKETMAVEQAVVNAKSVYDAGDTYLKSSASMLLDPSARQCYDAWLDVVDNPTPEKKALTKARFLWFNQQDNIVKFSEAMLSCLGDKVVSIKPQRKRKRMCTQPICRECRCGFDFQEKYLVLHCHCTTRVGHVECLTNFDTRNGHKCPVCRKQLLMRHQVSKYLFWNVKEKFKFVV
jgi:hypothetical protein